MFIATPVPTNRVLSTGETYTPEKNSPPQYPCGKCYRETPEKARKCDMNCTVCDHYMDYELMNYIYKHTVFD